MDEFSESSTTPALRRRRNRRPSRRTGKHAHPRTQPNLRQLRGLEQSYRTETCRPIVSLAFVIPLILLYEVGTIWFGHPTLRSGIDQWMDRLLSTIGFGQVVILPIVTAAILIVWHHRSQDRWQFQPTVLAGMLVESCGLGLILYCAANAFLRIAATESPTASLLIPFDQAVNVPLIMAAVGSGIYEELIFRLILLLATVEVLNRLLRSPQLAIPIGILLISLVFAALHYNGVNPAGAEFEWTTFAFRLIASIAFCVLFLFRGFGIAVGAHAAFDVLTQLSH